MFYDISNTPVTELGTLSPEEKKKLLFLNQKQTLDLFLERNAISQAQYNKSLQDLIEKMGMQKLCQMTK
ncbi:MAG: hypothetical protein IKB09_06050 [Oscillospiraceae bacterium]|nr:hypothetical protein [Oscillospiraceae bacterium]